MNFDMTLCRSDLYADVKILERHTFDFTQRGPGLINNNEAKRF